MLLRILVLDLAGNLVHSLGLARIDPPARPAYSWRRVRNGSPCHQHRRPKCWRFHSLYGAGASIASLSFLFTVRPQRRCSSRWLNGYSKRHPGHHHRVGRPSYGVQSSCDGGESSQALRQIGWQIWTEKVILSASRVDVARAMSTLNRDPQPQPRKNRLQSHL